MHQRHNAEPMVRAGGAILVEDRGDVHANLAEAGPALRSILADTTRLDGMREQLRAGRGPDAAEAIATLLMDGAAPASGAAG